MVLNGQSLAYYIPVMAGPNIFKALIRSPRDQFVVATVLAAVSAAGCKPTTS
jgi:hypothetical protein